MIFPPVIDIIVDEMAVKQQCNEATNGQTNGATNGATNGVVSNVVSNVNRSYRLKSYRDPQVTMSKAFIGRPAPDFKAHAVVDNSFKTVSLSDYKDKYVVLFFYPADFTFVCPTEIIAFSDMHPKFVEINTQLLACSTDNKYSHFAWIQQERKMGGLGPMKIPILSDANHQISKDYGVLHEDSGEAYRGLFIIDPKGILRQITINDMPIGRSVEEALRLVQCIQKFETQGEVCPAGWKPGKPTMKPTPEGAQEYFAQQNN